MNNLIAANNAAAVHHFSPDQNQEINQPHIVVVGSGPVGMQLVNKLLAINPASHITLFGNEPFAPYNRVQLSSVLAGDISRDAINLQLPDTSRFQQFSYIVCAVESIDRHNKQLVDNLGRSYHYDQLILATGSRPFVPGIPGVGIAGVYTFRNLKDTDALYARMSSAKHIVVVGGGLLGIEAARALQRQNTKVTLIQQGSRLMNRQLDNEASARLHQKITALGIDVIVESGVRVVHGDWRVVGVTTRDGERIGCDSVLFCTGIKPNMELAQRSNLAVKRGIIVNDSLQTSDPYIYAIGECAEHKGETYGLVAPGLEQAAIVANIIQQGGAQYSGSQLVSQLKVLGEQVVSMGEVEDFGRHSLQHEWVYKNNQQYRKLVIYRGKISGAVAFGEWPESRRIQECFHRQQTMYWWQLYWFRFSGKLWFDDGGKSVKAWPAAATVCQCNQVSQGALLAAMAEGCDTLNSLSQQTGAGAVCGSCRPLLQQLLGSEQPVEKTKARMPVLIASMLALLLVIVMVWLPAIAVSETVQKDAPLQGIWNDKFWKQVTGFSLVGLALMGLLMSLRKKLKHTRFGDFAYWRVLHGVLGVGCVVILMLHTGLHTGVNLNRLLLLDFLLVVGLGALAGIVVAFSHKLRPERSQQFHKSVAWVHLVVSWPLPALIIAHIISVYYF